MDICSTYILLAKLILFLVWKLQCYKQSTTQTQKVIILKRAELEFRRLLQWSKSLHHSNSKSKSIDLSALLILKGTPNLGLFSSFAYCGFFLRLLRCREEFLRVSILAFSCPHSWGSFGPFRQPASGMTQQSTWPAWLHDVAGQSAQVQLGVPYVLRPNWAKLKEICFEQNLHLEFCVLTCYKSSSSGERLWSEASLEVGQGYVCAMCMC